MRDFQSALVGNHETVRKYGIVLTESALKLDALKEGMDPKTLTAQQKAFLRLKIIIAGSTDAIGDAKRTSESFANTLKRVKAEIKDTSVLLGQLLIPAAKEFLTDVRRVVSGVKDWASSQDDLGTKIAVVWLDITRNFKKGFVVIQEVFRAIMKMIREDLLPAMEKFGSRMSFIFPEAGKLIADLSKSFKSGDFAAFFGADFGAKIKKEFAVIDKDIDARIKALRKAKPEPKRGPRGVSGVEGETRKAPTITPGTGIGTFATGLIGQITKLRDPQKQVVQLTKEQNVLLAAIRKDLGTVPGGGSRSAETSQRRERILFNLFQASFKLPKNIRDELAKQIVGDFKMSPKQRADMGALGDLDYSNVVEETQKLGEASRRARKSREFAASNRVEFSGGGVKVGPKDPNREKGIFLDGVRQESGGGGGGGFARGVSSSGEVFIRIFEKIEINTRKPTASADELE